MAFLNKGEGKGICGRETNTIYPILIMLFLARAPKKKGRVPVAGELPKCTRQWWETVIADCGCVTARGKGITQLFIVTKDLGRLFPFWGCREIGAIQAPMSFRVMPG